jgi:hypothetical protein
MNNLTTIRDTLLSKKDSFTGDYFIPSCWNSINYTDYKTSDERPGEININPYDFFAACIDCILVQKSVLRQKESVKENLIYSVLLRSYTAWNHSCSDQIGTGTLLKTMALLPLLKKIGVRILYLLPVFSCSDHYKKGELGSPYSIQNFYSIDKGLHDPMLGGFSNDLLDMEFLAFTEACHAMGMKVILDFAFRTSARNNMLIADHPDWFYWIKKENADHFETPKLGDGQKAYEINTETIQQLYESPDLALYLSQFTVSPDKIDRDKWEKIRSGGCEDIDKRIEEVFHITTVPGFSDVINDHQPAWTDVTYLRFYFDNSPKIEAYLPKNQPPYIMQDGASLSHSHGTVKNEELWEYIAGILPFYRSHYGIDGARIDMAHALPDELNERIVNTIKSIDPHFILWSEELSPEKSSQAKASGFDFISGFTYMDYKKVCKVDFNNAMIENLLKSEIPVVASLETPDTPRSAWIHSSHSLLKLLMVLNSFMPNTIPMVNSGQELYEIQPMNLGLDNDENGRFVLPQSDPMYGKLAFFDKYRLHWTDASREILELLCEVSGIRERYHSLIADGRLVHHPELARSKKLTVLHYQGKEGESLVVAANRSLDGTVILDLMKLLEFGENQEYSVVFDSCGYPKDQPQPSKRILKPLETIIFEIKNI